MSASIPIISTSEFTTKFPFSLSSTFITDSLLYNSNDTIIVSSTIYEHSQNIISNEIISISKIDFPPYINYSTKDNDFNEKWPDESVINRTKEELNEILPEILNKTEIGKYYKINGNDFPLIIKIKFPEKK